MVERKDSNVDWRVVMTGILTAAVVGLSATVIEQGREIAAIKASREATIKGFEQRIIALESGTTSATSERFRKSDGDRLEARIAKVEERLYVHEAEDRLKFKRFEK